MFGISVGIDFWVGVKNRVAAFASYLLDIFSSKSTVTYTGGSLLTVPQYDNTLADATGVVSSSGVAVPAMRGANIVTSVAEGAATGDEIWNDAPNTIGAGWVNNGDGTYTATSTVSSLVLLNVLTVGKRYQISYDVVRTAGSHYNFNMTDTTLLTTSGSVSYESGTASTSFYMSGSGSFSGTVSNLSVKEVYPTQLSTADVGLLATTVANGAELGDELWESPIRGIGWTIVGQVATLDGTQTGLSYLSVDGAIVIGQAYTMSYEITSIPNVNNVGLLLGGASIVAFPDPTIGKHTISFIPTNTTNLRLWGSAGYTLGIKDITVKEVLPTYVPNIQTLHPYTNAGGGKKLWDWTVPEWTASEAVVVGDKRWTAGYQVGENFFDGTFDTLGTGWAYSGTDLVATSVGAFVGASDVIFTIGTTYAHTVVISEITAGGALPYTSVGGAGTEITTAGTYTQVLKATNTIGGVIAGPSGFTGVISSYSVREVTSELAGMYAECSTAGTTGTTAPVLTTALIGQTVTDNTASWLVKGLHCFKGIENWAGATNLAIYSEDLSNAAWGKTGVTALDQETIEETTASSIHSIYRLFASTTEPCMSASLKAVDRDYAQIRLYNASNDWAAVLIDLAAGVIIETVSSGATFSNIKSTINPSGDGYYMASLCATRASGTTYGIIDMADSATPTRALDGGVTYLGDGASTIKVTNLQFEQGSTATPYIPTTTASATRTATNTSDVVTGAQIATNLLSYSEQFDNAAWTPALIAKTANQATAPDGNLTADEIRATSASYVSVFRTMSVNSGVIHTLSVYGKASSSDVLSLEFRGLGSTPTAIFNLTSGTLTSGSGAIESAGDGWYRCSITVTSQDASEIAIIGLGATAAINDSIYIWGAQLEAGSTATTYIPTTTAPASAIVSGTGISQISGAIAMIVTPAITGQGPYLASSLVGGADETSVLMTATSVRLVKRVNSVTNQAQFNYTHTADQPFVWLGYWDETGMGSAAFDQFGVQPAFATNANTDLSPLVTTGDGYTFEIGSRNQANHFQGQIQLVGTWATKDEMLTALTDKGII